ncbi:hypothetical protein NQZ68_024552 [Dissostichus eleginoides]|nr:hypothetical protein NQZ68_024552 [Dissostichus eleginoides]
MKTSLSGAQSPQSADIQSLSLRDPEGFFCLLILCRLDEDGSDTFRDILQPHRGLKNFPEDIPPTHMCNKSNLSSANDQRYESASPALPAGKSKSKPKVGKGDKGKGKGKAQKENPPPGVSYSFTEAQEEAIARWVESNKLLYDMKDKQYKDKALRRHLWEGKAAEYGCGRANPRRNPRSGPVMVCRVVMILAEEASENDSDRDKFIRRVFGFLKPHIRRHKKDTPASFKDKSAPAETGELAGSDDSTMAGSLADEPREPTTLATLHRSYVAPYNQRRPLAERQRRPLVLRDREATNRTEI